MTEVETVLNAITDPTRRSVLESLRGGPRTVGEIAAGYSVTREYYINDAGAQVDVLARSAFLRYREALGEDIGAIPEGLYPGD